jgi:hypothetical protein
VGLTGCALEPFPDVHPVRKSVNSAGIREQTITINKFFLFMVSPPKNYDFLPLSYIGKRIFPNTVILFFIPDGRLDQCRKKRGSGLHYSQTGCARVVP